MSDKNEKDTESASKNIEKDTKEQAVKFIRDIEDKYKDFDKYIYRGTAKEYSKEEDGKADNPKGICSGLYRLAAEQGAVSDKFDPIKFENEVLMNVKHHFPSSYIDEEKLTEMQHYGGKTNLIDFSNNIYVALFFSCYTGGEKEKEVNGELLLIKPLEKYMKNLSEDSTEDIRIIKPLATNNSTGRVNIQSSVFVYPDKGYIPLGICIREIIPKEFKKNILSWLDKFHNINENTIYNDLTGFIQNKENFNIRSIYFSKANKKYFQNDYDAAINHYDTLLELYPESAYAYNNRGISKYKSGHHIEAIKDFDRSIALKLGKEKALCNRGEVLNSEKFYYDAITDFDDALIIDPKNTYALTFRGIANFNLKRYKEANKDFSKILNIRHQGFAFEKRKITQGIISKLEGIIDSSNKILEKNKDDLDAIERRGNAYLGLEEYDKAIKDFSKLLESNSDNTKARNQRCLAYLASEKHKELIKDFSQLLLLNPDNDVILYMRGNAYLELGEYIKAIQDYRKTLVIKPQHPVAFRKLNIATTKFNE